MSRRDRSSDLRGRLDETMMSSESSSVKSFLCSGVPLRIVMQDAETAQAVLRVRRSGKRAFEFTVVVRGRSVRASSGLR